MRKCENSGCGVSQEKLNNCFCGRKICDICFKKDLEKCHICNFYSSKGKIREEKCLEIIKNSFNTRRKIK